MPRDPRGKTRRLVLLPGMDGTAEMFAPLLEQLPPHIEPIVVTYPLRGPDGYDDLLPAVLAAVRAAAPCAVLGWSFSGPLAVRAAATLAEHVRALVLVSSFVTAPIPWLSLTGPLLCTPAFAVMRVVRRLPIWLLRPSHDPLRRAKARIWQTVPAATLANRARAIRAVDVRAELVRCGQPLLYLRGTADRIVRTHNVECIRKLRPDLQVAAIPGGHFALFSAAAAGAAAIARFVDSTAAGFVSAP
jgi:pimeloyl-ACP methyl ester carboxylesterase